MGAKPGRGQRLSGATAATGAWLLRGAEHPESLGQLWRAVWNCRTPELFSDQGGPEPLVTLRVLQNNSPLIAWVLLVSAFVGLYATLLQPHGWPDITSHTSFLTPFTLTSFAVSLLMLFRTNSSYGRWWEARSACGRMFNHPRIMTRLAAAWMPPEEDLLVRTIGRWAAALNPAAFAYIRADPSYWQHATEVLTPKELRWLRGCEQAPFAALQVISQLVSASRSLDSIQRQAIENEVSQFDILVGAAERISRQPIPLAYTRHTTRFIVCFVTFLPFAFWPLFGWASLPIMGVLSFLLVGLENIGIQIEEPYRVLPLHRFCMGVKRAVQLTLEQREAAAAVASASAEATRTHQWPPAAAPTANAAPGPPTPQHLSRQPSMQAANGRAAVGLAPWQAEGPA
ncbi:hypothetical protein ABPG75_004161 [Micractinium tetrahymenae]